MDDIVLVQVVDSAQHLLDGLRGILFGKLSLVTDAVKKLPAGSELCDNVKLILQKKG